MTNSLIPYSFIPGTKAMASEVNANFIALANGIDEGKSFTTESIEKFEEHLDETLGGKLDTNMSNSRNITNCVVEVPQDIKYEITSDGLIILKAGSRVYVSTNGTFEAVTLTSDTAAAAGGLWTPDNSRKVFVVYMPHSNAVISQPVDYTFSQAGAPTSFIGDSALWYDTTNRVLKCTWNNGANWYICSLPIMLGRPGLISSGKSGWAGVVDNVFNGMGFFGSTVWVGNGVKGLAPNRRNADGTLRNNLVVSKSVNFYTNDNYTTSRTTFVLSPDASVGRVTGGRYDASRNINVNSVGNDSIFCPIAEGSLSSGRITSFTPLQCFQAADAQNFINKDGDTMRGVLFGKASALVNSVITTAGILKSANGYVKLGNGIILQWGRYAAGSDGETRTITFPTAFSNTAYSVAVTQDSMGSDWYNAWYYAVSTRRTTSMSVYARLNGCVFNWIAVGY